MAVSAINCLKLVFPDAVAFGIGFTSCITKAHGRIGDRTMGCGSLCIFRDDTVICLLQE